MSQPVNYYLLRPKHSGDLAWIWLKLNAAQLVSKYLTATARGMGHQRVHVDELLRMPIERPDAAYIADANKTLERAERLLAAYEKFQLTCATRN